MAGERSASGRPERVSWAGKVVLITGAASGVGAACARYFAGGGARVALVDLDPAGEKLAADIGGIFLHFDVGDHSAWEAGVASVIDRWGRLDLVHLNAGVTTRRRSTPWDSDPVSTFTDELYRRLVATNVDGVVFGVMTTIPHLLRSGAGHIIVTASVSGLEAMPSDPLYSMSKHATIGFVRSAGPTLASKGLSIQVLCPLGIDTPMITDDQRAPGRTFAPPEDVVGALVDAVGRGASGDVWVARGPGELYVLHDFALARSPVA